jgi:hypothetical protein
VSEYETPRVRELTVHRLKIWLPDLEQILIGRKRADVRKLDRDFRVGDILHLVAWDPSSGREVPEAGECRACITHIERMAGPLILAGIGTDDVAATPVGVLSIEVVSFPDAPRAA